MSRRARWTGFAGGVLLAVGAWLAGARPGPAPAGRAEALWGVDGWFRLGLSAYVVGFVLLAWAWWTVGRALRGPAPPGPRTVLTTGLLWTVPLLLAPPLGSRDVYSYACQGAVWLAGHDPQLVGAAEGGCPWLAAVPPIWRETGSPYGAVAVLGFGAAVALARVPTTDPDTQLLLVLVGLRLLAVGGVALAAVGLPRLARVCGVDPGAAAWLGLAGPLVAVHAVSGGHVDAWVAGLIVTGLAAAAGAHRAPAAALGAGAALGAAVAVKVTAVVALPFLLLLVARWGRAPVALAAAGGLAGYGLPAVLTGTGVGWVAALSDTGSLAQWSSPPTAVGMTVGYLLRALGAPGAFDPAVAVARGLGVVALAVVAGWLLWWAWRRRRDPAAALVAGGLTLAAVVVLGPVFYPWYALVPVAVLAGTLATPRTRWWLAVATLPVTALTLPSGLGIPVLTRLPGALLMVALVGVLGWVSWRGLRRAVDSPPAAPGPPPVPPAPAR